MRSAWFTCPLSSLSSSRSHAALTYEFSCLWRPPRSPPPPWAPLARCLGGCGLPTRARHCSEQPRRRCNVLPASGCLGFHDRARAVAAARWQIPLPVPPRPTNLHAVRQDDSPWRLAHARAAMTAMAAGDWVDALELDWARTRGPVRRGAVGDWGKILRQPERDTVDNTYSVLLVASTSTQAPERLARHIPLLAPR